MKRRIFSIIVAAIVAISAIFIGAPIVAGRDDKTTFSEDYIPSETLLREEQVRLDNVWVERVEPNTYHEASEALAATLDRQDSIQMVYNNLITLGYPVDHPAVIMARIDMIRIENDISYYQEQVDLLEEDYKWELRAQQYPVATEIWLYMKNEFNWPDNVCAGVMGNIMGEVSGGSLKIPTKCDSSGPYGMFQWLGSRKIAIKKLYGSQASIEQQLEFMYDELYGSDGVTKQVQNWQREAILDPTTKCEKNAMAFCKYFERPGGTGLVRRKYARIAYDYFVD